ncbi:MAG: outer membrane protein assembly factor BamA [Paracoccaceae bacterium]
MGYHIGRTAASALVYSGYFKRLAVIAFLALALVAFTGSNAARAQAYQFSSFQVSGNQRVDAATILSRGELAAGVGLSQAELNAAYQRVLASGLFESVEFVPRGGTLLIRVVEYPTINLISIEGNTRIDDETALAIIQSRSRLVFNPAQVERDAAALVEAYQLQGRFGASVIPRIIQRSNNRVDLVFEINETRPVEVERLSFIGNREFSGRRLRRVLQTKQTGALRALLGQDTFIEERVEFDRVVLRDFYRSRGFPDFQILSVSSEFSRQRNAFFVTFTVREGQKFEFGQITTVSEMPGVDAADFQSLARIRPGSLYSPVDIDNTISRMEQRALQLGLNLLRVEPRVTRNDRDLTLDIEFALVTGPRIFVERIDITGNNTTFDRVIRRQFRLVEGDPFNPREIREAAGRIRRLPMFSGVDINARQGSAQDQVVVDVAVEERLTGSLAFGASFSATSGIGATASYTEANFLGRGQTLNFDFTLGLDNANGGVTFVEPALLDRDLSFRFESEYRQADFDYTNYSTQSFRIQPSLSFPVTENGRFEVSYEWANDRIFNVDVDSSPVLMAEAAAGAVVTSALGLSYRLDRRRTGIQDNAGILFSFGQEFAGLGGAAQFAKSTALLSGEMQVFNDAVTLRATFEGGALIGFSGDSRISDRFTLNSSKMRGFAPAGIGPRDLTVPNRDALGGNYFAVARFETEFPLGLPEEIGLDGGLFLDIGTVWGLDNTNGGLIDDTLRLRSVVGFSLLWATPIGPLRLNFSRVLMKEAYDQEQNFDLTVSTRF